MNSHVLLLGLQENLLQGKISVMWLKMLWKLNTGKYVQDIFAHLHAVVGLWVGIAVAFNKKYDNKNRMPYSALCEYSRTRGSKMKWVRNRTRCDTRKHFFTERIVNIWNSLPACAINSSSVNVLSTGTRSRRFAQYSIWYCLPCELMSMTVAVVDCSCVEKASNDATSQTSWDWKRDLMLMQEYLGLITGCMLLSKHKFFYCVHMNWCLD